MRQSGNVVPSEPILNVTDSGRRHTILVRKSLVRSARLENRSDSIFIKDSCVSINSLGVGRSALLNHIMHVVGMCSSKQVVGIDARADVASVADIFIVGQRAMERFERESGGGHCFTAESRSTAIQPIDVIDLLVKNPTSGVQFDRTVDDVALGGTDNVSGTSPLVVATADYTGRKAVCPPLSMFSHKKHHTMADVSKSRKKEVCHR